MQILLIVVITAVVGVGTYTEPKPAQGWVLDQKVPGYLDDTFTPFLVADQNRTVHAFATQRVGDGSAYRQAIIYRQWRLTGGWTSPIDILLSPTWDARVLGAYLDPDDIIHLIFWGSGTDTIDASVYYSKAPLSEAGSISAWSYPELIARGALNPPAGVINGDDHGNIVVVFNGNSQDNGVYMVRSNDSGENWTESVPVYLTNDSELFPFYIKSDVGPSGKAHIVWNVNAGEAGIYESLYYIGIDLETGRWIGPQLLDQRPRVEGYFGPSVPAVVDNGTYVMILYNGGNPYAGSQVPVGRPTILVRLSENEGDTWGDVTVPFPFLTGQSGEQALMVDSNKVIHVVAGMRIDSLINGEYKPVSGVWHSEFVNKVWRYPERFVTSIPAVDVRAVISQGNVLMANWNEDPIFGRDGVWFSYTFLDSPELPLTSMPVPTTIQETPILGVDTTPDVVFTPSPIGSSQILQDEEDSRTTNPQLLILVAIISVGIILIRATYNNKRR